MAGLQKNVASQNMTFVMVSATTGGPDAAATVSVAVTKDNGTQGAGAGSVSNKGGGQYNYAPTQSETNATDVGFLFTATGDIPVNFDFHTDVVDANGLPSVNTVDWNGTAVSAPATAGIPDVNVKNINNVSAASVTTISANQGTTQPVNFTGTGASALTKSDMVDIAGAASVGTAGYVGVDWGQVTNKTTTNALTNTTISASSTPTAAQVATAVWQDATAGDFTVANSIGASLYTAGVVPGAAGGLFIAGTNAATTVNFTGNLTGNLTGNVGGNLLGTLTTTERNAIADALLDRANAIETGITPRLALRYSGASVAGLLSGVGTATYTFAGVGVATTRIVAAVDATGRTAVTLS